MNKSLPMRVDGFWVGGSGMDLRSQARIIRFVRRFFIDLILICFFFFFFVGFRLVVLVDDPKKLPNWNYDGSSTPRRGSVLKSFDELNSPQVIFKDPFRRGNNILVHLKKILCI
ncbi:putative glutamine synthetase [Helianthus anomalus]